MNRVPANRVAALTLAVALSTLPAESLRSQSVECSALVSGEWIRNALIFQGAREETAGLWFGGSAELKLGPVTLGGHGLRGNLGAVGSEFAFDRTAGEIKVLVRVEPVRWVGLEGSYTVRGYSSAAGYQRWDISAVGIVLSTNLGSPTLRAYARGSALPSVFMGGYSGKLIQTDGQSPGMRLASEVGLKIAPQRVPLLVVLSYRFERYDFPVSPTERLEQLDAVGLSVGYRIGR